MDWKNLPLWDHQKNAILTIKKFLKDSKSGKTKGSCLIKMPTGTGKTGVIAVGAYCFNKKLTPLVVTPSKNLCEQIVRKLKEEFWITVDPNLKNDKNVPLTVKSFTPTTLKDALSQTKNGNGILVCTIQTLEALHRPIRKNGGSDKDFQKLSDSIGYVFFDEGHREPAPAWAKACRALNKPIILLSATPYRNDYKLFEVDQKHTYLLDYHSSLKDNFVREVEFKDIDFKSPEEFVGQLIEFCDNKLSKLNTGNKENRIIIRCSSKQSIIKISELLKKKKKKVAGIHSDLSDDKDYYHASVPNPLTNDATFWIHQYMLTEGLDDNRFSVLAIYEPFSNARSFVQQVGRVIRNPELSKKHNAIVLSHSDHKQKDYWENYLTYENEASEENIDLRNLPVAVLNNQPSIRYLDRDFRTKFDPTKSDLHNDFHFPKRANFFEIKPTHKWNNRSLAAELEIELKEADCLVHKITYPSSDSVFIAYTSIRNTPVLLESYFMEFALGFIICIRKGIYLSYYNSQQSIPDAIDKITNFISPESFKHLIESGSRTTSISLMNTDLSDRAPRRRTLYAHSIKNLAPGLVDHAYFPSTLQAYVPSNQVNKDFESRYVGFNTGRVSERTPNKHTFNQYVDWVGSRLHIISSTKGTLDSLFNRYAEHTSEPKNPTATHILLDIQDILGDEIYVVKGTNEPLEILEPGSKISNDSFEIVANGKSYSVLIKYLDKKKKYELTCKKLDDDFVLNDGSDDINRGLIKRLNIDQSFRIIPTQGSNDQWVLYAHGNFYRSKQVLNKEIELLDLFEPIKILSKLDSEKGKRNTSVSNTDWSSKSIFGLIDKNVNANIPGVPQNLISNPFSDELSKMDLLICDDMNSEVADFIAGDSINKKVVFIHVKFGKGITSATQFHDVCSQATKNLQYLTPSSTDIPPNINTWDNGWSDSIGNKVDKRIREGNSNGNDSWEKIKKLIRSPATEREVWIVMGGKFDKKKLEKEVLKKKPKAHIVQLYYLIQSTWAAVSATGAKLRIFTPKK